MGGNMIDRIVKTAYLRRLDQITELRHSFDLSQVVDDFNPEDPKNPGKPNPVTLSDLSRKYGVAIDPESQKHVDEDWLGTTGHPWFTHPQNLNVLRRGLFEAVKLVQQQDKPIDAYWVCAIYPEKYGDPQAPLQVMLAPNSRQITLFLITPHPGPGTFVRSDPLMKVAKWDDQAAMVIYNDVEE